MDLSLNETQTMLRNSTAEFMEREFPRQRVREIDDSPTGFAADLWRSISELGWPGIVIPQRYGGSGGSFSDLAVIYEVLGSYACSTPLLDSAVLSAHLLLEAADDSQKRATLPAIAEGQQIFSFACTEREYVWGPQGINVPATRRGRNYVLNGTKLFVPWAHVADQILVAARTSRSSSPEQGISLFLVDAKMPGVTTRLHSGWIGDKVAQVDFDNVELAPSSLVGPEGAAWPAIERAMDKATAVLCAYMAGGAQRVYEMGRDYSQTRIAFGVPIGTFQRVQDYVIDALEHADATKWTAYEALWKVDEGHSDVPLSVSTAKAVASEGFPKACDASHVVIGGVGIDVNFGLTHYTKRARTFQLYLGDAHYHRRRMAAIMGV